MVEKKLEEGNLARQENIPRVITIRASEKLQKIQLRVAAYTRVSSNTEDQLNSFAAQSKFYTTLISSRENWEMVDLYADEGITGTSAKKRPDFQRMMADCRRGLIDRILVKSISRFARNTKECLEAIRELKILGVSIYFEKENIDTATMSGEMMTTLFASFAQSESQSISGNMRWSYQKRMQSGNYLPGSAPYGYRIKDRKLVVNEKEAEVIRRIFRSYLDGDSMNKIAETLNCQQIYDRDDKLWYHTSISYILTNERYIGDSLWQKTYTTDSFPFQHVRNKGERTQYYVHETHVPIIDKDTYQRVQETLERRRQQYVSEHPELPYPLRKKLICKNCGRAFRRKVVRRTVYWCCPQHDKNSDLCCTKQIPKSQVYIAFCRAYFKLKHGAQPILPQMLDSLRKLRNRRMIWSLDVIELNKKISELICQNQVLATLKQRNLIDSDIFISQSNALTEQLRAAKLAKERLLVADSDKSIEQTQELIEK